MPLPRLRDTSNKTRIETIYAILCNMRKICLRDTSNKTRIETVKVICIDFDKGSLRDTSNKTRIETVTTWTAPVRVVAMPQRYFQ